MAKQLVYKTRGVTVYYEPDRRSIARCAVGPELTEAVHDIVNNIAKPYAIGISPRDTGEYKRSWRVDTTYVAMGFPDLLTRVAARLVNTHPAAAAIEWGNKGRNAHHVLSQTLTLLDTSLT